MEIKVWQIDNNLELIEQCSHSSPIRVEFVFLFAAREILLLIWLNLAIAVLNEITPPNFHTGIRSTI